MHSCVRNLVFLIALISFALAFGSGPVTAQESPCKKDVQRLCGDVKPGDGRIQACLKAHKDEISQECRDSLEAAAEKVRGKLEAVAEACKDDAAKLCPGIEPGEGRILKCLMQHKEELSERCRNSMNMKK
jgi:hypothetical protein